MNHNVIKTFVRFLSGKYVGRGYNNELAARSMAIGAIGAGATPKHHLLRPIELVIAQSGRLRAMNIAQDRTPGCNQ